MHTSGTSAMAQTLARRERATSKREPVANSAPSAIIPPTKHCRPMYDGFVEDSIAVFWAAVDKGQPFINNSGVYGYETTITSSD